MVGLPRASLEPMTIERSSMIDLGPFEAVGGLTHRCELPQMALVRQALDDTTEKDLAAGVWTCLEAFRPRIREGMSVAVTAGSRGIADIVEVLRAAGEWLRAAGAEPFVVPAMGSHGGATAEGQVATLAKLGINEASVAMSIRATMDTVELGRLPSGPAVHLDREAAGADGILVVNRIKAHTDFHGPVESGLGKILAIGLGKRRGAEELHSYGPANLSNWIPQAAERIISTGKVIGGLGLVENGYDHVARVVAVEPGGIGGSDEAELLVEAKRRMARLPFEEIDVAIVDWMGKDKSGSGLDTNVIGRMMIRGTPEPSGPRITNLVVLGLTPASGGNAVGLGLADFVPRRLLEAVDLYSTYVNALTSGLGGPQRGQIPMVMPTDADAVAAALLTCGRHDTANARVVRVRSTLELDEMLVSESLLEEVLARDGLDQIGELKPMCFEEAGQLTDSDWLVQAD